MTSLANLPWYGWIVCGATILDVLLVIEALATKTLDTRHLPVTTVLIVLLLWMATR